MSQATTKIWGRRLYKMPKIEWKNKIKQPIKIKGGKL
jgi:hypothetical protein